MRNSVIKKNRKVYIFKHQQTSSGGGGGGADLENNKTATIDVSAYTGPVAITPTAGKDGMKKTTVTLSNIPSGGSATAYAWKVNDGYQYLDIDTAPTDPADINNIKGILGRNNGILFVNTLLIPLDETYTYVSDTEFTISYEDGEEIITDTYTRDTTKDFTLWQLSE